MDENWLGEDFKESLFVDLEKLRLTATADSQQVQTTKAQPEGTTDKPPIKTEDYVLLKTFTCPVCAQTFKAYVARESKLRLESLEYDMRPVYQPIDPSLYNVLACEHCGYCAVSNVFGKIMSRQIALIKEEVAPYFRPRQCPIEPPIDMVIDRYKLALFNAIAKQAKDGEKAYLCLRITWLYRMKGDDPENEKKYADLTLKGFNAAVAKELPPIMGIEENTLIYLLGAFSMFLGDHVSALKIFSEIVVSKQAPDRLKNMARDQKDEILAARGKNTQTQD